MGTAASCSLRQQQQWLCLGALLLLHLRHCASAPNCTTWYDTTHHGKSWVSAADFGATPDGVTDSTAAIQAAVDSGRGSIGAKRRATVYLPSGKYVVSDTIVLWAATTFVGSSSDKPGCRSTLVLRSESAGFADEAALKPVLVTSDGYNRTAQAAKADGWWVQGENANDVFYNQLHHIDLRLGEHNPGAVGVLWHPAQGTSVRDMSIDASGGFSGIDYGSATGYFNVSGDTDGGGGGTLESIVTLGGKFGVRGGGTNWMFRSLRIANASVAGLLLNTGSWNNVFLDTRVTGCPIAVNISQRKNNIVMLDSTFILPASGGTGVNLYDMDVNETGIAFSRLTIEGGDFAVRGPTLATTVAQSSTRLTKLQEWRSGGFEYVDDKEQRNARGEKVVFGELVPTRMDRSLPVRSKPRVRYAYNVLDAGAVGDCKHDDTKAIQGALANYDTVFLPATSGQNGGGAQETCYRVSDTLVLRSNSTLLGEGGSLIKLAPSSPGFGDHASPKPLLQTEDDPYSRSVLMDLLLDVGDQKSNNAGAILVQWRAGQASSMHDVHPRMLGPSHIGIHVTGSGAGLIDNSWVWGADHNQSFGSAHIPGRETICVQPTCPGANVGIAIDSSGPTYLYGTNSEHHVETSYRFDGASDIYFLMGQNEFRTFGPSSPSSAMCTSNAMDVRNSSNIHIYGVSACSWKCLGPGTQHPLVSVRDARNVSLTGMYAVCHKDARGVCYMLGAKNNDSRFGMGKHHVVAADWARVGDWA